MEAFNGAILAPAAEMIVNIVPGRQVMGQVTPGTACAELVEKPVHHFAQRIDAPAACASAAGFGQAVYDELPLIVGQVTGIGFAAWQFGNWLNLIWHTAILRHFDNFLNTLLEENLHKYELWLYQDNLYGIGGSYSKEHQRLLVLETADQDRQKFERLKAKFSAEQTEEIKYERERIPEDVRIAVWRRDQGKCVGCGSRERLEYDHIVPVTRGGSNTSRNVELLCEACNRAKGDRIQ